MTERVVQYRLNADKCFELAKRLSDPESKHSLLIIANAWLTLAAQRAKNLHHSSPCPRRQSGMVWYKAELEGRRLQHGYQCEKCGFISETDDARSARMRA